MSQERWDVVLTFTHGPLSFQGDIICRGPVVRMGAKPGPGGLVLDGYRGLDNRQAVITAYDGGTVSIAPVGTNQVRVAPHENVNWHEIQTLRNPVYLSPGDAFHLGSPDRGVTALFVEARRLGTWEQRWILSDASQVAPGLAPSEVRELDVNRGRPKWFIPAVLLTGLGTSMAVMVSVSAYYFAPVEELGPVAEGREVYQRIDDVSEPLDPNLKEGIKIGFNDFVMKPNADKADWKALTDQEEWDQVFYDFTSRSVQYHAKAWKFWQRLDQVQDEYAYVVQELRKAGLPEVLAAIPYQESQYLASNPSPACAEGWWQLMPEVANRTGIGLEGCTLKGSTTLWKPDRMTPVKNVIKNAVYIEQRDNGGYACKIKKCTTDERKDLQQSTRASIDLLKEAWVDDDLAASGAVVQLTVLSHNSGYDDSRYDEKKRKQHNILWAYRRYLEETKQQRAPDFYGQNIKCIGKEYAEMSQTNATCGGKLLNQSQHYAFSIVAQHILAVCYYGDNYSSREPFNAWRQYTLGDRDYCSNLNIPPSDKARTGGK